MKPVLIATTLAASFFATNLLAAETQISGPLPAGQAAGVKRAQAEDSTVLWMVAAGGVAGLAALALGNGDTPALPTFTSGGGSTTTTAT